MNRHQFLPNRGPPVFDERYLDFGALRASLNSPLARKIRQDVLNEYYRRIALPFASFGFALLGIALASRIAGRDVPAVLPSASRYCSPITSSFARHDPQFPTDHTGLAGHLFPNLLSAALGLWLFWMSAHERQFHPAGSGAAAARSGSGSPRQEPPMKILTRAILALSSGSSGSVSAPSASSSWSSVSGQDAPVQPGSTPMLSRSPSIFSTSSPKSSPKSSPSACYWQPSLTLEVLAATTS